MEHSKSLLGVLCGTLPAGINLTAVEELDADTPFGQASASPVKGKLPNGQTIVMLNRHGQGHVKSPSSINYPANIWALKRFGVTHVLSLSACGSLSEKIVPGKTLVIPDQLFDWTKGIRPHTFFPGNNDLVAHISLADPICTNFSARVFQSCNKLFNAEKKLFPLHLGGTYVVIEGPNFSTRAESEFFKSTLKASVVGMTALPEAKLAREIGLCYAILCLPADYDSWHRGRPGVTADEVAAGLKHFTEIPELLVAELSKSLENHWSQCSCRDSLKGFAIHSDLHLISDDTRDKYKLFAGIK